MFELMTNTDPEDCYRRWICDVATGDQSFSDMHPFLNFVDDDEDLFVPDRFKKYSEQLKSARRLGEDAENHQVCEETFQCPFTGERLTELMKETFSEGDNNDNV